MGDYSHWNQDELRRECERLRAELALAQKQAKMDADVAFRMQQIFVTVSRDPRCWFKIQAAKLTFR